MGTYRFADFTLDTANRRLTRGEAVVDVQGRYFDALALMAANPGQLVTKDRFLDEVWRGVPVTDEALTQCMRALRKALGDDAANPKFIETVPKHGYRFVAPLAGRPAPRSSAFAGPVATLAAGTLGGGLAGLLGGLAYGVLLGGRANDAAGGAFSLLLVMAMICTLVSLLGAFGVSAGIAMTERLAGGGAAVAGGAIGGAVIGFLGKLLSLDAFHLVVGRSPGNVTGGAEGLVIGGAVGLGLLLARRRRHRSLRPSLVPSLLVGSAIGALIPLFGGALMAGSLDLMAHSIPGSRLGFDGLLGAPGHVWIAALLGACEGALFVTLVVGGMELAARARRTAD